MSEQNRERLGRAVREAWVRFWRDKPGAKPSWLTPYDTLPLEQREVDDAIGAELYALGRSESGGLVFSVMGVYHDVLLELLVEELTSFPGSQRALRQRLERVLTRMERIALVGHDAASEADERVGRMVASKREEIEALLARPPQT
jgi:hypothetical protein